MMKQLGYVIERRMNRPRTPTYRASTDGIARGLGWFSIGLGLAETLMPRPMARGLGMRGRRPLLLLYGLRALATGIGLLAATRRAPWMWGRVAGDALDMATLAAAMRPGQRVGPAIGLAAVAAVTVLDVASATALSARDRRRARPRVDYSDRSGFPRPASQMRGAARKDFQTPRDMAAALPASPQRQEALPL